MVGLTLKSIEQRIAELQTALSQSSQQLITVRNVVAAVEAQVTRLTGALQEMNRLKGILQQQEKEDVEEVPPQEKESDISEEPPSLDEDPQ